MKQNEKFLVYAVTGFLVVILAVAILFGKEVPRRLPNDGQQPGVLASAPPSLEEVLNRRAAAPATDPSKAGDAKEPADGAAASATSGAALASQAGGAGNIAPVAPAVGDQPLVANVQLLPPSPAAQVTEKLGLSRREHDYRIVRARAGDSLGALAQKWCGSTGDYLEVARGLNEELTTLRVGQEVVLPWVDDEVLLAAFESRGLSVPAGAVPANASSLDPRKVEPGRYERYDLGRLGLGRAEPAVADRGVAASERAAMVPTPTPVSTALRKYKIKAGESLWKIAERDVGRKQAPRFLDQVRELNPGLDADRIREGQEILLPAKN